MRNHRIHETTDPSSDASPPLRIGFIGTGNISRGHLQALSNDPRAVLAALCDANEKILEERGNQFKVNRLFTSHRQMLETVPLDAVFVCTPTAHHYQPVLDALDAGAHVFCEKPLASDHSQSLDMAEAAERAGRLLMTGMTMRFRPAHEVMKTCISEGLLGRIRRLSFVRRSRRKIPNRPWFTDMASGGGVLRDLGIHSFDLLMWASNEWAPERVSAVAHCIFGARGPDYINENGRCSMHSYSADDQASGMVRFQSGAVMDFQIAWASDMPEQHYYEIVGDKAGLRLDAKDAQHPLRIFGEAHGRLVDIIPQVASENTARSFPSIRFLDAIATGAPSPVPPRESVAMLSLIDAIYSSAACGREVAVPEPAPGFSQKI